ncbi:response regulator [Oscillatoria salina]|uniref:response regulator n=1 Tax=Oscillatoria salina TaxID=331517 RepID=UPI0013B7C85D|nr:response regulator [Oscillatoria salina]MBZ8183244.1 response regulator [Oscillatoria salina IIICB1]NET88575.1 response regulator [Kamptonema sp. SIO1D9]
MKKRILIIDDEAAILRIMQVTLSMTADWEILTAQSGWEGIEKALSEQPDAILLDLMMPELNGIITLEKLRAQDTTCQIPVIIMSAKSNLSQEKSLCELEIAGVITKPFDPLSLADQISDALKWSELS